MESSQMLTLYIGTRNLSSWSLRPWLLLATFAPQFNVEYECIELPLDTDEFYQRIKTISPNARVPALHEDDFVVWDSLAICEYLNERYFQGRGWPKAWDARACARSMTAEMHSSFQALRGAMPMNLQRRRERLPEISAAVKADIHRVRTLWREAIGRFGGPFLCGEFSIADCFFAPVCTRFHHYGVELSDTEQQYVRTLLSLPQVREWYRAAGAEAAFE
jgi:glutathione S-transferase